MRAFVLGADVLNFHFLLFHTYMPPLYSSMQPAVTNACCFFYSAVCDLKVDVHKSPELKKALGVRAVPTVKLHAGSLGQVASFTCGPKRVRTGSEAYRCPSHVIFQCFRRQTAQVVHDVIN